MERKDVIFGEEVPMNLTSNLHGIIRGKTIELADDPGLKHGQEVEVTLLPVKNSKSWGDGLRRAAGALADDWSGEDDEILRQIQLERMRSAGRTLPS